MWLLFVSHQTWKFRIQGTRLTVLECHAQKSKFTIRAFSNLTTLNSNLSNKL